VNVFATKGNQEKEEYEANVKLLAKFAEQWPLVAEYLLGLPAEKKEDSVLPSSVRFFLNGGRLKVQISPKGSKSCLYATIEALDDVVTSLEEALRLGKYEVKRVDEQKIPY